VLVGYVVMRSSSTRHRARSRRSTPPAEGYLGGLGLPVLISWPVGGLFAAGAAYLVGKVALGLRSDYLAIATLGIAEIILAILKNENWLTRGVKNVTGIPRPIPSERELQGRTGWSPSISAINADPAPSPRRSCRLGYALLFRSC
jgi:branched-chain amino acid transport system permease protein